MTNYSTKYLAILNELRVNGPQSDQHLNSRVLIVDGLNTFIRAYAASPVTNSDGEHVGGISGTLMSIGHAIKNIDPTRVIIVPTYCFGGSGEIRTHGGLSPSTVFKTVAINHSATLPYLYLLLKLTVILIYWAQAV